MAKPKSIYTRLTGRKRTPLGYTQLWLGPDHLLLVRNRRVSEQYQRFSLADIQAIVVTHLPDQMLLQIAVLAAIGVGAGGFFAVSSIFVKILFAAMAAFGLIVMISNIALGPRCLCHLQTAVSRELLPPVARVRTARAFLERISPAIEAVQGSLTPEQAATVEFPATPYEKPPEVPHPPGYLPEALFVLFLVDAALVLGSVRFPQAQLSSILLTTISGEIVILTVALIRRAGRDPRRVIYAVMILAILGLGWDAYHLGGSLFAWANGVVEAGKQKTTPPSMIAWVGFTQPVAIFAATWRIAAGVAGLAAAWLERPK